MAYLYLIMYSCKLFGSYPRNHPKRVITSGLSNGRSKTVPEAHISTIYYSFLRLFDIKSDVRKQK